MSRAIESVRMSAFAVAIGAIGLALAYLAPVGPAPSLTVATASQDGERSAERERAQYVRTLEPICFRDTRRSARILRGVQQQVRQGETGIAARRFHRATRAFTQTLRTILAVPRPEADRHILNPWLGLQIRQRSYLAQITRALIRDDRFKAQGLSVFLIRNAQQANMQVTGYGFNHCLIQPNRFL